MQTELFHPRPSWHVGWKRSPGRAGCEMQRAWGESQGCEMGGKVVSQANLTLQARAGCSSWGRQPHGHCSPVPSCLGILLVLETCLYLALQYHPLTPLALPTRIWEVQVFPSSFPPLLPFALCSIFMCSSPGSQLSLAHRQESFPSCELQTCMVTLRQ